MSLVLVGSDNPVKVRAVGRALDQRPDLRWKRDFVVPVAGDSGVRRQPTSLDEAAAGARNRVRSLRENWPSIVANSRNVSESDASDLLVGIESGIFEVMGSWFDTCVVSLWSEGASSWGFSSSFVVPVQVMEHLTDEDVDEGYTLNHACRKAGLTTEDRLGHGLGIVGVLSGGLLTREDYTFEGVRNALFGLVRR